MEKLSEVMPKFEGLVFDLRATSLDNIYATNLL